MDLVSLPNNPVPGGALIGALQSFDGSQLRYARWTATRGPRRGTVCLFGGRGEYIEKYFEVIADLRRRGFAVATLDWRGQGGSERKLPDMRKGYVRDFSEYDRDLSSFMKGIVLPDCPPPYIAMAHSMGAHILLRNAVLPGSWFDRMILVAPMIAIHRERSKYAQSTVRLYSEIVPLVGLGSRYIMGGGPNVAEQLPIETGLLTSDRERWARNKAVVDYAPELGLGSPSIFWLRAAYRSMMRMQNPDFAQAIRVPCLVFAAGKDRIVDTRAIEDFGVRLKVGSQILLPGSSHEILQETDTIRQKFWAAFDAYLGVKEMAA
jgi:lysophospholipase